MDWRFQRSKWAKPPKMRMAELRSSGTFRSAPIRWGEIIQPDIIVVDKWYKKTVVVDVAIPSDSNIRRKEPKKLEK